MDNAWHDTFAAIADWASDPRRDAKFGHIQGPAACAKGVRVPLRIWDLISKRLSDTVVMHVVGDFKKAQVIRDRATIMKEDAVEAVHLETLGYNEFTEQLKRTRTAEGWAHIPGSPHVLIIVEADPDISAEFVFALAGAVACAGSCNDAVFRVLTMSWEDAHPIFGDLVGRLEQPPPKKFVLPEFETSQPKVVNIPPGQHYLDALTIEAETASGPILAINFGSDVEDPRWDVEGFWLDGYQHAAKYMMQRDVPPMFEVDPHLRLPERLHSHPNVYIITTRECRRRILDLKTTQLVEVSLMLSRSEQQQQLSWMDRTTCPRSNVTIFADEKFDQDIPVPRRMEILNGQVGGFLAGLTEYATWPAPLPDLFKIVRGCSESGVIRTAEARLVQQGLMKADPGRPGGISMDVPGETMAAFYRVLPMVNYDARIAYFLSQPASAVSVSLAKVQVASILVQDKIPDFEMTCEEPRSVFELMKAANVGMLGKFAPYGTTLMALGLCGAAKIKEQRLEIELDRQRQMMMKELGVSPERIAALAVPNAIDLTPDCTVTRAYLRRVGCAQDMISLAMNMSSDSMDHEVTDLHFDEICLHLARAFSHQAVAVQARGERIDLCDVVSLQEVSASEEVAIVLRASYPEISALSDGMVVGFYTKAVRWPGDDKITISDWNWIPLGVWEILSREMRPRGGISSLISAFRSIPNKDEVLM
ncbi:hypothetical protein ACJ41O_013266 [Fusarium nematophilum]